LSLANNEIRLIHLWNAIGVFDGNTLKHQLKLGFLKLDILKIGRNKLQLICEINTFYYLFVAYKTTSAEVGL